jgi:hypothetical protein
MAETLRLRYGFHPHCRENSHHYGRNRHGDEVALTNPAPTQTAERTLLIGSAGTTT